MKIAVDNGEIECIVCHESNETLVSAHANEISHIYHMGCLSIALYRNSTNGNCLACTKALSMPPEYLDFINSPSTVFLYACKNGMLTLVSDILQEHSLHEYVIQAGFACATYGNHIDIIRLLFENYFVPNESSVNCLSIAIQQKNLDMVELWYKLCSEKDLDFNWRIITEDQTIETFNFLDGKINEEIFCFHTCLIKALRTGNIDLAQKMSEKFRPFNFLEKIKYYWNTTTRIGVYLKICEASLWGDLNTLTTMKGKGLCLNFSGDLALISAHFMKHSAVECYLKSNGCKLKKKSLFYKLADACAKSSMKLLTQNIDLWHSKSHCVFDNFILRLMLLLSIRNENILMIDFILSKCSSLSAGIINTFEYVVDLQNMQLVHVFLRKFDSLAYYAVVRGSYFNNVRFVEEVSLFLCQDHRHLAFLRVFQYGILNQNLGMIRLAANVLNLKD